MIYINPKNNAKVSSELTRQEAIAILLPHKEPEVTGFIRSLIFHGQNQSLRGAQVYWFYKKAEEFNPNKTATAAITVGAGFARIQTMFKQAKAKGLKKPRIKLKSNGRKIILSLAPDSGNNKDHIYVKINDGNGEGDIYSGKVTPAGEFKPVDGCPEGVAEYLQQFANDPLQAIIAYGRETGECSCCGRELTNHVSIELGIGPICRERFGF
jgi:hypothetical protein